MTDDPEIAAMKSAMGKAQRLLGESRVPGAVFEAAFRDGWAAAVMAAPLPVAGYRPQSDAAIALVNEFKADEERLLRKLDALGEMTDAHEMQSYPTGYTGVPLGPSPFDRRWLAIARSHLEQGFMALNRAVFQPGRVKLPEDGE